MPLRIAPAWLASQAPEFAGVQNFSDRTQHEDIAIGKPVQPRLGSSSSVVGRLTPKREIGVHHFHALYRQVLRA